MMISELLISSMDNYFEMTGPESCIIAPYFETHYADSTKKSYVIPKLVLN
jgi:hypothetical protein